MVKDYYNILGVGRTSGPDEIKSAFRKLAMIYHPDKNPGNREAEEFFRELREAYETLCHPQKRKIYDSGASAAAFQDGPDIKHIFSVEIDHPMVRLNQEVRLSYTYTGEGRIFLKPALDGFFMTGPPFVAFSKIVMQGVEVKKTTLTYIIAPLVPGKHVINEASIRIGNRVHKAGPLVVEVTDESCYYSRAKKADGKPFKYRMHYASVTGSDKRRALKNVNHTILVPRSHYATINHGIGMAIKVGSILWGMALCFKIGTFHIPGRTGWPPFRRNRMQPVLPGNRCKAQVLLFKEIPCGSTLS